VLKIKFVPRQLGDVLFSHNPFLSRQLLFNKKQRTAMLDDKKKYAKDLVINFTTFGDLWQRQLQQ
jgi:hypothetical protein